MGYAGEWVEIEFATSRLRVAGQGEPQAIREFGVAIGRNYIHRLKFIDEASNFGELRSIPPLRLHQLRGNRSGQYVITLTANFRMVFERIGNHGIRVLAIEDYH